MFKILVLGINEMAFAFPFRLLCVMAPEGAVRQYQRRIVPNCMSTHPVVINSHRI